MNRPLYTNSQQHEVDHGERIAQLSPIKQAVATLLQAEADLQFGPDHRYHRGLPNDGSRAFADHHLFASMIALPKHDAFEVRVHLPTQHPAPDVATPLHRTTERGENVTVYHYWPARLQHLLEVVDLLRLAQREVGAADQ